MSWLCKHLEVMGSVPAVAYSFSKRSVEKVLMDQLVSRYCQKLPVNTTIPVSKSDTLKNIQS